MKYIFVLLLLLKFSGVTSQNLKFRVEVNYSDARNGYGYFDGLGIKLKPFKITNGYGAFEGESLKRYDIPFAKIYFSKKPSEVTYYNFNINALQNPVIEFLVDSSFITILRTYNRKVITRIAGGKLNKDFNTYLEEENAISNRLDSLQKESDPLLNNQLMYTFINRDNHPNYFIQTHPSSLLSLYYLNRLFPTPNLNIYTIDSLFSALDSSIKYSTYGIKIKRKVDSLKEDNKKRINNKILIGFSDFEKNNEKHFNLNELLSGLVLLEFGASWCSPCKRKELELSDNYDRIIENKIQLISVSIDNDKLKWLADIKSHKTKWLQLHDINGSNSEIMKLLRVFTIPFNLLLYNNKILGSNLTVHQLMNKQFLNSLIENSQ